MPLPSHDLLQSHEARLKDLEVNRSEVASQLAAQTVQLDYLGRTIETGLAAVGQKLEEFAAPIALQVQKNIEVANAAMSKVEVLDKADQERTKKREERRATVKKILAAITIAALGAVGKEAGTFIWHHWF